ncbi:GerA spore germination protein [Paenibacillus sp. RU4T]|uniref:spore germination protein n=1 Tax=unclassified Paenibacillus TaxID=185978 RepID=UPI00095555DA|nr:MULTISPECIES: spore germination protein [unclassified Paenibacillus]SIQ52352.1 GerA spore germination protein [Paenibacillus sp. RU4X]SIQ74830.1 GerA spore germination protein [Paenibacillus sp. RU4T]
MAEILETIHRLRTGSGNRALFGMLRDAFGDSADYKTEAVGTSGSETIYVCFLASLCSTQKLDLLVGTTGIEEFSAKLSRYSGTSIAEGGHEACETAICNGSAVLCTAVSENGLLVDLSETQQRSIGSPITESVLQGPMYAFNENLDANTALIRQQIRSPKLKLWETRIGETSRTRVAIFYCSGAADPDLLAKLKERLQNIRTDGIQDSGQLLRLLISRKKMGLFPLAISSERPDRSTADLLRGKMVVMIDGSPFALTVPAVYTDFWHSPEDNYVNPYVAYFLLTLRFLAMFMNLFLPAMYVALTSVNVDVNRLEISLAASASREGVPYPVFIETFLMLIIIDFITEAGIRLPKTISSTVTMVGGVVLGQAIIQANIVSNLLVIIVAATAITNFIVIDYQMGLVQRILKYFIVVGATVAGLLGIVFCFTCLVFYLSCLESFGAPYLTSLRKKEASPS